MLYLKTDMVSTLALFTRIGSGDGVVVASRLRSMTADQSHCKDGAHVDDLADKDRAV